jgi:hypothetical protein
MFCDMIGSKTRHIARFGDFQPVAVLLVQAQARVIQMIKNAKSERWPANAVHLAFLVVKL